MLDRYVNIFLFFALIFVFILFGDANDHLRILLAFLLAILFSFTAFMLNWLTLDGAVAAVVFGTISFGLGGIPGAAIVLTFFITGSMLSKDLITSEGFLEKKFRRNGYQVWSNGFWFSFWILIWFLIPSHGLMLVAISTMAMATADTWSSEIGGTRMKAKAWMLNSGKRAEPGKDGAVSIPGSFAALAGSALIAGVFLLADPGAGLPAFWILTGTGFAGCFIDSYLGARFQHKTYPVNPALLSGTQSFTVSNNAVNWFSAGITSLITLVLILILGV